MLPFYRTFIFITSKNRFNEYFEKEGDKRPHVRKSHLHTQTQAFRSCFLWKQKWPCLFACRVWISISPVEMHCNCDSVLKCSHVAIPPTDYQHVMPGPNPLGTNSPEKNTHAKKPSTRLRMKEVSVVQRLYLAFLFVLEKSSAYDALGLSSVQ